MLNFPAFGQEKAKRQALTITSIDAVCLVPSGKGCDKSGVRILLSNGKEVQPAIDQFIVGESFPQRGVSHPAVSPDKKAAGWLIEYDNCCTSYPLPLTLVIYRPDKPLIEMKRKCSGAIWEWHFVAGGKRVATFIDFPHPVGDYPGCSELFDAATGRQLHSWVPREGRKAPAWINDK